MCDRVERMICARAIHERRRANMCEASVYMIRDGKEELLLNNVDLMEPLDGGRIYLMNLSGEQKIVHGRIRGIQLVDHKILLELEEGVAT
jgi:predicted RNA-binding protein